MKTIRIESRKKAASARPPASPQRRQHRAGRGWPKRLLRWWRRFTGGCFMEWGKLFANLPDDPRVQAAEDSGGAFGLLVESMCYCTAAETGGFIPDSQLRRFLCHRPARVTALAREELWVRDDTRRGYLLDPEIWNEDRNLSDSAEKKREADKKRIAAKRAAAKAAANGHPDV